VADVQAGTGGVAANVKGDRLFVHEGGERVYVGTLGKKAALLQGFDCGIHGAC